MAGRLEKIPQLLEKTNMSLILGTISIGNTPEPTIRFSGEGNFSIGNTHLHEVGGCFS